MVKLRYLQSCKLCSELTVAVQKLSQHGSVTAQSIICALAFTRIAHASTPFDEDGPYNLGEHRRKREYADDGEDPSLRTHQAVRIPERAMRTPARA